MIPDPAGVSNGEVRSAVIRDFLTTAIDCLRASTGVEAIIGFDPREPSGEFIAVHIPASGALRGVTWSFPMRLVVHCATAMFQVPAPDRATRSSVALELANVLTGLGTRCYEVHGLQVEIEPPALGYLRLPGLWATLSTCRGTISVILHGPTDANGPA